MSKHYFILLLLLLCVAVGISCRSVTTSDSGALPDDADMVVEMLKNGLQAAGEATADRPGMDEYGAALVQTALERFVEHPAVAAKVKTAYGFHVDKADPSIRYAQWELLLDYLDRSLNHCRDTADFRTVWQVRREIVAEQQKVVLESVKELQPMLDSFSEKVHGIEKSGTSFIEDFKSFEPNEETKGTLDFLLTEIDRETNSTATDGIDKLRVKATSIARRLDGKLAANAKQLNQRLDTEKRKDATMDGAEAFEPKKNSNDAWESGPYHRIMEEVAQTVALREDTAIAYWLGFLPNTETNDVSGQVELGKVFDEARRLQHIRYNLWVTRRLAGNPTIDVLAHIDTGFLVPSVAAIYAEKENELMKDDQPSQRQFRIRKLLLTPKIRLEAF